MDKYLHTASILFWSPYYSESSPVVEVSEAEVAAAAAEVLLGILGITHSDNLLDKHSRNRQRQPSEIDESWWIRDE